MLYNGNNGAVYDTEGADRNVPATCGRAACGRQLPANGIQNGSPDGIALVEDNGTVVEFLSYEGDHRRRGPANGLASNDIGVMEDGQRSPWASRWRARRTEPGAPAPNTFGACNDARYGPRPSPYQRDHRAGATVSIGCDADPVATRVDAGQPVGTTFAWTSSTPGVATVSAGGVVTGVAPGDAIITAAAPNGIAGSCTSTSRP